MAESAGAGAAAVAATVSAIPEVAVAARLIEEDSGVTAGAFASSDARVAERSAAAKEPLPAESSTGARSCAEADWDCAAALTTPAFKGLSRLPVGSCDPPPQADSSIAPASGQAAMWRRWSCPNKWMCFMAVPRFAVGEVWFD